MVLEHAAEHVVAPLDRARRIADRVAGRRKLRQRGQHRAFGNGQLIERLAVVELGRRRDAVRAMAEEDLVEVELEDLVLGQRALDAEREEDLGELARVADFRAEEEVARDLLGDRRAAGHVLAAGRDDQPDGAEDAADVDAPVGVEIGILGGEEGLLEPVGHVLDAHRGTLGLAEGRNELVVGRIDPERHLQADVLQASRPRAGAGRSASRRCRAQARRRGRQPAPGTSA